MKFIKKKDWKSFQCYYCDKLYKFWNGLTKHMESCKKYEKWKNELT